MRLRVHTEVVRDFDSGYPWRVTLTRRRPFRSRITVLDRRFGTTNEVTTFVRGVRAAAEIAGIELVCT